MPVMNEADLKRIEDVLGRPLPEVFRSAMLNFPQRVIDAKTFTDPDGNVYVDDMIPRADSIIAGIEYRRGIPDWPQHFIVVAENGCGEEYSVDISGENCPVYESGPHNIMASGPADDGYFEIVANDFRRWVGLDRASH